MFALIIVILIAVAAIAWNVYPPLRKFMRSKSTLIESVLVGALLYGDILQEGYRELQKLGILPAGAEKYWPYLMLAYFIVKRIQTTTPVIG